MNEKIKKLQKYYELSHKILEAEKAIDHIIDYEREILLKGKPDYEQDYAQEARETKKELYKKLEMMKGEREKIGKEIKEFGYELMRRKSIPERIKHYFKGKKFLIILLLIFSVFLLSNKKVGYMISQEHLNLTAFLTSLILTFLILKILRLL
ncbi:MAG: hypothetical protein QXP77_03245 [Candidatus Aenigmatarchaeota archaeon]